jgi:Semialdehyde dehydrogenase, NAD binding domain
MKWSATAVAAALFVVSSSDAFSPVTQPRRGTIIQQRYRPVLRNTPDLVRYRSIHNKMPMDPPFQLNMAFTVGIVGATGAVGKEIRTCLEARDFPVEKLRIFGSERSAGSVVSTEKYGDITVELFSVAAAKQCDVVFLAVSGEFSLQHARALTDGDNGCVVIDNSVRGDGLRIDFLWSHLML